MGSYDVSLEEIVRIEGGRLSQPTYERYVIIPDYHAPYEDYRALHAIYKFIKDYQPNEIIMMGDHVDFYALSRFDKNPERISSLQQEIDVLHYHLRELRKVHPEPKKITYLRGNHEFRLIKYLWRNPEVHSLRRMNSIEGLLELDKFGIDFTLNKFVHGVLFKHGNIVRKHSAYTAKGEFDNEGTSGVSGHTHRIGSHYLTNRSGEHAWYEMGHVCDEAAAEYMEGKIPNWQKGFGVMVVNPRNRIWTVYQIPITNNAFIAFDRIYTISPTKRFKQREALA